MALFEGKTPAERNKTIAALVLGALALLFIGRMLFGSSGAKTQPTNTNRRQTANRNTNASATSAAQAEAERIEVAPRPVVYERTSYDSGEPGRNIFAYYVRPAGTPRPPGEATPPPATPTPTPPLVLGGLSPQSVYAQTGEFAMQLSGDKFTPETRVYVEGQELPTEFRGPQQLAARVPAQFIQAAGVRQIVVRTPDNTLYSNAATLNVMQPPVPNFTYIGYIERARRNNEAAILRDPKGDLYNVQVDDLVNDQTGNKRFRITGISARAVELVDKDLKIKHTLPYIEGRTGSSGPVPRTSIQPQPPPNKTEEDEGEEEPEL